MQGDSRGRLSHIPQRNRKDLQQMDILKDRFRKTRFFLRWSLRLGFVMALVLAGVFFGAFYIQIFHHFFLFPKQAALWKERNAQLAPVALKTGWNEYRGVMHSHSEVSHDSEATPAEIAAALKKAKCQFICMSDHYVDGKADYSLGWKGDHDGILFIRGFEMDHGLMPWGLPDSTVFDAKEEVRAEAKRIRELGGVVAYAHCEETKERDWDLPELEAMEIYNIHATMLKHKTEKMVLWKMLATVLTCYNGYADQCFYSLFERPDEVLRRWDDLNVSRHISGFGGNDTHQNAGLKGMYTADGNLLLSDTGHKFEEKEKGGAIRLNFLTRSLLRMVYGPLEPGRQLFRYDLDNYVRSALYVRTHLLAKNLTEPDLVDALRAGRGFVSFDMVADGTGFVFMAQGAQNRAVMGESIKMEPGLALKAFSPCKGRFMLLHNGIKVDEQEGREYDFTPKETGKYRIEVYLNVLGKDQLWLMTNPIAVTN